MNSLKQRMVNARPHPSPLPRGEGTGCERFLIFGRTPRKSSREFSREAANGSPSPGGEGRGEGRYNH